jgi:hypothetical protein
MAISWHFHGKFTLISPKIHQSVLFHKKSRDTVSAFIDSFLCPEGAYLGGEAPPLLKKGEILG